MLLSTKLLVVKSSTSLETVWTEIEKTLPRQQYKCAPRIQSPGAIQEGVQGDQLKANAAIIREATKTPGRRTIEANFPIFPERRSESRAPLSKRTRNQCLKFSGAQDFKRWAEDRVEQGGGRRALDSKFHMCDRLRVDFNGGRDNAMPTAHRLTDLPTRERVVATRRGQSAKTITWQKEYFTVCYGDDPCLKRLGLGMSNKAVKALSRMGI
ncbi:hypothetical protein C8R43DRAFT_943097 [Mycena crocata]|nr:hypothetical protein C8R43DRAFT_943097 [Mycena crocata]